MFDRYSILQNYYKSQFQEYYKPEFYTRKNEEGEPIELSYVGHLCSVLPSGKIFPSTPKEEIKDCCFLAALEEFAEEKFGAYIVMFDDSLFLERGIIE